MNPTLLELQEIFVKAIKKKDFKLTKALKIKSSEVAKETRFNIYMNAYWLRTEESLSEDFSRVKEKLGSRFANLVFEFLGRSPSRFTSLGELSTAFFNFILKDRPVLKNLALDDFAELLSSLCAWSYTLKNYRNEIIAPSNLNETINLDTILLLWNSSIYFGCEKIFLQNNEQMESLPISEIELKILNARKSLVKFSDLVDLLGELAFAPPDAQSLIKKWAEHEILLFKKF